MRYLPSIKVIKETKTGLMEDFLRIFSTISAPSSVFHKARIADVSSKYVLLSSFFFTFKFPFFCPVSYKIFCSITPFPFSSKGRYWVCCRGKHHKGNPSSKRPNICLSRKRDRELYYKKSYKRQGRRKEI